MRSRRAPRPVVVAGLSITALGTIRCLAGGPYEIWLLGSSGIPGPALASRIPHRTVVFPAGDGLVPALRALRRRFAERPALLLTEDRQAVEVAHDYPDVADDYRILLPPRDLLDTLMDKARFTELALSQGLPIPRTRVLHSAAELASIGDEFGYPYILKPYLRHARKIAGPRELAAYAGTFEPVNSTSLIVQEWVAGGDDQLFFCFLLMDERQQVIASFLGRKLRQSPPQDGTTSYGVSWRDDALVERTAAYFKGLGYRGFGSVEYKFDAARNEYLVMEPTVGRFDQQIALTMAAGVNFPRIAVDHAFGDPLHGRAQHGRSVSWISEVDDFVSLWKTGRARSFAADLLRADVTVLFNWRDPLPLAYKLWHSHLKRWLAGRPRGA